jgi:hypothetical protein
MRPALDSIELPQVQQIRTQDRRALAEHRAPTAQGSLLQDLGRAPTTVIVLGVASDPQALDTVTQLHDRLAGGAAVPFVADILTGTKVEQVVVDDLRLSQVAGDSERFAYALVLREFVPVAEPSVADLDPDVAAEAAGLLDDLLNGIDLARLLASGLEPFVPRLRDALDRLTALSSRLT